MEREDLQQGIFARGQCDHGAAASYRASFAVDRDIPDLDRVDRIPRGATDQRPQPREQLRKLEGLDEVVVGAVVEPFDAIVDGIPRGEDQDRCRLRLAQRLEHFETVELRQHEIEDESVVLPAQRLVETLLAVAGAVHRVAGLTQRGLQASAQIGLVLDDQNSHANATSSFGRRRGCG
jgi:hypothetical protein